MLPGATNFLMAQEKFSVPFVQKGVCPFECCQFGRWRTQTALRVFKSEGDTSRVIFNLAVGDSFRAMTGNIHMEKVGVVVVTKPVESFAPGDTVYTLSYGGEGYYSVWHRGTIHDIQEFWYSEDDIDFTAINLNDPRWKSYSGVLTAKPLMIWWVNILLTNGQTGWLRLVNTTFNGFMLDEQIEGMDGCG